MSMSDYLVRQVGIEVTGSPSLLGAADHDQLSSVFVGELGDSPAGAAVISDVPQYVSGSGNPRGPETTNGVCD
jgi:hypothetical protein